MDERKGCKPFVEVEYFLGKRKAEHYITLANLVLIRFRNHGCNMFKFTVYIAM